MHRLAGHAWVLVAATAGAGVCLELVAPAKSAHRAASPAPVLTAETVRPAAAGTQPLRIVNAIEAEPEQTSSMRPPEPKPPKLISLPVEATRPAARQRRGAAEPDAPGEGSRSTPPRTEMPDAPPPKRGETGLKPPAFVRSLLQSVSSVLAPLGLP